MNGTTASTTTSTTSTVTLETLREVKRAIQRVTEDPIKAFMVEKGFDPASGGVLVLPEAWRSRLMLPFGPPDYLRFSRLTDAPILVNASVAVAGWTPIQHDPL